MFGMQSKLKQGFGDTLFTLPEVNSPPPPLPVEQQPGYSRSSVLGGVPAQSKPSSKHSSLTQLSNALRNKSFVRISRQFKRLSRFLNKSSQFSYSGVRGKYCLILIILRK